MLLAIKSGGDHAQKTPPESHTVFKSKVALAAIKGDKTLTELSQQFDVHPHQITQWKTQLPERARIMFEGSGYQEASPIDIKALHAKIGELTLGNNFLEGAWRDNVFIERLWLSVKIRRGLPSRLRHGL